MGNLHNFQTLPWEMREGGMKPITIVIKSSKNFEDCGYLKILIGCIWDLIKARAIVALRSILTLKRALEFPIFNRMIPLQR